MKVRVSITFNHELTNKDEGQRLIDLLKEDGRIAAAINTYGGDAVEMSWERRRDRKVKVDNVVTLPVAQAS
jgi:hypothetical protein